MLAEVKYLDDFRPQSEVTESKVADLDNGYTRIADEILEYTMASGLSETELCIIMAVWRKTYGFNKKVDWISNEQLETMIRKHLTHCSTAKNLLINKKVLIQQGRKVGINTNLSEWETKNNGFCKTLAKPAKKTLAEPAIETKQKLLTTIDTITKENKDNNTPLTPQEVKGGELAKPTKRKSQRINYDEYLISYNEEVGDRLPHATVLNDKRKRLFKKIISKLATPNVDGWRSYVRAFVRMAKPWYFGDNPSGWTADIDHLLKEDTLTAVREGKPSLTGR
ncbi:MAG TPA: DNA replication protein [Providencia sp.]|uniref:replication protein n=1 Tax=Providencia sp. TaxID=589 RepID=UPI000E96B37B|nr:DNA replication protein [Providencia sp.]